MRIERGQVAVITGGASGIGKALARRALSLGMRVVVGDVEERALAQVAHAWSDGRLACVKADVAVLADVEALAHAAITRFGQIDLVCNNAGVNCAFRPIWEASAEDWTWVTGVNLMGVAHGIKVFVPRLVSQGSGHVLNVASMAGLLTVPNNGVYNATKHAVVSMSETLHADLASEGHAIGVTVFCPGLVESNIGTSARNRPTALAAAPTQGRTRPAPPDAKVMAADEAARVAFAAVERNQLYAPSDPAAAHAVRARLDHIVSDCSTPL